MTLVLRCINKLKTAYQMLCNVFIYFMKLWSSYSRRKKAIIIGVSTAGIITAVILIFLYLWNCVPLFYWWPDYCNLPNISDPGIAKGSPSPYTCSFRYTNGSFQKTRYYNHEWDIEYKEIPIDRFFHEYEVQYDVSLSVNGYPQIPAIICRVRTGKVRAVDIEIDTFEEDGTLKGVGMIGYTVVEMKVEKIFFDPAGACSFQAGDTILCLTSDRFFLNEDSYLEPNQNYVIYISDLRDPEYYGNLSSFYSDGRVGVNNNQKLYNEEFAVTRIRFDSDQIEKVDDFYTVLYAPYEEYWRAKIAYDFSIP